MEGTQTEQSHQEGQDQDTQVGHGASSLDMRDDPGATTQCGHCGVPIQCHHCGARLSQPTVPSHNFNKPPPKRLMTLPSEVRIMILKHVLISSEQPYTVEHPDKYTWDYLRVRIAQPWQPTALFPLCKELYKEASEIFYGQNHIRLRSPHSMTEFVSAIGPISRHNLRKVTVMMGHTPIHPTESWPYLTECKRLESLTLEVVHNTFNKQPAARQNCRKLKGLKALLEVRGMKEVDVRMQTGRLGMIPQQEAVWRQRFLDVLQVLKEEKVAELLSEPGSTTGERGDDEDEEDVEMGEAGEDEGDGGESDDTEAVIVAARPKRRKVAKGAKVAKAQRVQKRPIRATKARRCKKN